MTVGKPAQRTQREFRVSTQIDGWQILLTASVLIDESELSGVNIVDSKRA